MVGNKILLLHNIRFDIFFYPLEIFVTKFSQLLNIEINILIDWLVTKYYYIMYTLSYIFYRFKILINLIG